MLYEIQSYDFLFKLPNPFNIFYESKSKQGLIEFFTMQIRL